MVGWKVIIEEYNRFNHNTLNTTYEFKTKQEAMSFIPDIKESKPDCGILLDGTNAIDDEDSLESITRIQFPKYK